MFIDQSDGGVGCLDRGVGGADRRLGGAHGGVCCTGGDLLRGCLAIRRPEHAERP
jgi:hypothetical protein